MKRFYKLVSIKKNENGFHIALDGRNIKTKSKSELLAPNETIANLIMAEWSAQGDEIVPNTMPIMQILSTKIDRISTERQMINDTLLKYIDTDLLCYHADAPAGLVSQQKDIWGKWITWFNDKYNCELKTTTGLSAITQDKCAHDAIEKDLSSINDDQFTILQLASSIAGSVILGLAFTHKSASAQDVFDAHFLEENFKDSIYDAEKYGPDPSIEKAKKAAQLDLNAAQKYLASL